MSGLLMTGCGKTSSSSSSSRKIFLIGLDGANWPTLDPLIKKGKLPFFAHLKEQSAWGNLKTYKPTKSSVIWTSIATGKTMEKHGILDFFYYNKNKKEVPYSNAEKREPSIWQILDRYNMKSMVLNWFVSHPPDKLAKGSIMVSDNFKRLLARPADRVEEYKNSVHPSIYFHKFLDLVDRNYERVLQEIRMPDYQKLFSKIHPDQNFGRVPILNMYNTLAMGDYLITRISTQLLHTKNFDFFATYLRMPDLVQHFSLRFLDKKAIEDLLIAIENKTASPAAVQAAVQQISEFLEPAYRFCDRFLQEMIGFKKYQDATFIICSDHGFSFYPGGYNHYNLPETVPAPPGILIIKSPDVRRGPIEGAKIYDIAPTILSLYDLPVGREMDGRPLSEVFNVSRKITYKRYPLEAAVSRDDRINQQNMKELRQLGYVGSTGSTKKKKENKK